MVLSGAQLRVSLQLSQAPSSQIYPPHGMPKTLPSLQASCGEGADQCGVSPVRLTAAAGSRSGPGPEMCRCCRLPARLVLCALLPRSGLPSQRGIRSVCLQVIYLLSHRQQIDPLSYYLLIYLQVASLPCSLVEEEINFSF